MELINDSESKRFVIISVAVLLVAALIVGGVLFFFGDDEKKTLDVIALNATEKEEVSLLAEDFVKDAGTWGAITNKINGNNIIIVRALTTENDSSASRFFTTRQAKAVEVKEKYTSAGPLANLLEDANQWVDAISLDNISTFTINSVDATAPDKASFLVYENEQVKSARVQVNFRATQVNRIQTGDDTSWDGTFSVLDKKTEGKVVVTVIQTKEGWKVRNVSEGKNDYMLVSWGNPVNKPYGSTQFDFTEVSTIKAKIGGPSDE